MRYVLAIVWFLVPLLLASRSISQQPLASDLEASWASRQKSTKNVESAIVVQTTYPAKSQVAMDTGEKYPPSDLLLKMEYTVLFQGDSLFRTSRKGKELDIGTGAVVDQFYDCAWSQGESRSHFPNKDRSGKFPTGFIGDDASDFDNMYLMPVLIHFLPNSTYFNPRSGLQYEFGKNAVQIDGKECFEYRPKIDSTSPSYVYFVSPDCGYCCTQIDKRWGRQLLWSIKISHEKQGDGSWGPVSFDLQEFNGAELSSHSLGTVATLRLNQDLDPSRFQLEFPKDTYVSNRKGGKSESYIVREGMNRIVTRGERANGIDYDRYLVTESGQEVGRTEFRGLWVLLGVCVFCFVFLWFWRKRK